MSDEDNNKSKAPESTPLTALTNRERHFVEELVRNPITATEAARRSYNVTTDKSAQNTGSRLMNKPSVIEALQYMYELAWPDVDRDVVNRLMNIVREGSDSNAISAIKEVAKMRGYNQPTKSQVVKATIKLPGSDEQ